MNFPKYVMLTLALGTTFHTYQADAQNYRRGTYNPSSYFDYAEKVNFTFRKPFQRYAAGFNFIPVNGEFQYQTIDEFGTPDSMHSVNVGGWGVGLTYAIIIPMARVGAKSITAVHIGITGNYYMFNCDDLTIRVNKENYTGASSYSGMGAGFMFGLPVGIDFITGGEASLRRSDRISFTAGAGIFPMGAMSFLYEFGGVRGRAPLYAKAELGIFAGINWKLRAMYMNGSPNSFSLKRDDIFSIPTEVQGKFKANDQLIFSLLVQPFSFGWR